MMSADAYQRGWERFRSLVKPGDVLEGTLWRGNSTRWLVDLGAVYPGNLDVIDADPEVPLEEGRVVAVFVKRHQDRLRMPIVSSRPEVLARARRRLNLPDVLRGEIIWPPPVGGPVDQAES